MNYDHAFHAGNHADLLKHALTAAALSLLIEKPKPICAIDFFAGAGRYDLALDERAERGGEWRAGIGRLWEEADTLPPAFEPYLRVLRRWNPDGALRWYPGSPGLALELLRQDDKLLCVDAKPSEAEALEAALGFDSRLKATLADGWKSVESYLPPTPRRGFALIDPPFEQRGEFARMARAAERAMSRWATGVVALWWPILDDEGAAFDETLRSATAPAPLLRARLTVANAPTRLKTSALAVLNPPFRFDAEVEMITDALVQLLAGSAAVDWLTPPR